MYAIIAYKADGDEIGAEYFQRKTSAKQYAQTIKRLNPGAVVIMQEDNGEEIIDERII